MKNNTAISVTTLVELLQDLVEDNFVDVFVQGELSNVSQPASGHYYFTLKDAKTQIRCAMFRSHARALRFKPGDGLAVICRGRVSIYPQRGDLQLLVEAIEPVGVGDLQLAFEQLKAKLEREGLFDLKIKKQIPPFPQTIAVVTSATGAAFQDILNVLRRRSAGVKVLLRSVRVQGVGAGAEIATAIAELNRESDIDVLIVGRGGGSREDLWPFNEEVVARAIVASTIPVISAVGHEVDISISDLAADLRAPTPSAAAELVVQNRLDLERHLDQLTLRLAAQMRSRLSLFKSHLHGLEKRLKGPQEQLRVQRLQLQQLAFRLRQAINTIIEQKNHQVAICAGRLESLSPLAVLSRGYAIIKHLQTGAVVHSSTQLAPGDGLEIQLADGKVVAAVMGQQGKDCEK
ncbi:Exodeoxyribonuclease VII large subunit [Desulfuromusa kysingii]|uniref:Exodeoxyribonuclease 7 large subunit n=1 Tax=Desulfuromusa kysingii TaxID=37625 RepID=A0A1H3YPU9_9BACT|nr:exodeoxyribonuclease VII large subunit [Desulfuromusa kysingii]SEA13599.1 Exodeoxyribonuclease VII large subunit [Desulfuromusa kysingii]